MPRNVFTSCRRGLCLIVCLLAGAAFAGRAAAGTVDLINAGYYLQPGLDAGNANKIAAGKLNHLHAVFANGDGQGGTDIMYEHFDPLVQTPATTNDPHPASIWDEFPLTLSGTATLPALALDTDGSAVVAWVSKASPQNALGEIWYRYQYPANCYSCWSVPHQVVIAGTEPSIAVENGTVYLAWTSQDRVQFTSFGKSAPPAPLWLGDVVDFTNCPNTRLRLPSIALVHPPCGALNVKIAALLAANEQSTGGSCHSAATAVGPRVYERDNATAVWSQITFQAPEVVTSAAASQPDPVPVSISLNSNRLTGDFYLAWSDDLNGTTRTRLGHANGATWDFSTLDTLAHHVHIAAKKNSAGKFRLAVSDPGWSTSAYTQTGKWGGGQLTWTGPATAIAGTYPATNVSYWLDAHPQALYWGRCAGSHLKEIKTYTEADDASWDSINEVATDLTETSPYSCLSLFSDVLALPGCIQSHVSIGQLVLAGGGDGVLVDLGDAATVTKLSATGAEIAAFGGGTIQITWAPGEVLSTWENGFTVATSRASVRVTSSDARYTIEDLGVLSKPGGK